MAMFLENSNLLIILWCSVCERSYGLGTSALKAKKARVTGKAYRDSTRGTKGTYCTNSKPIYNLLPEFVALLPSPLHEECKRILDSTLVKDKTSGALFRAAVVTHWYTWYTWYTFKNHNVLMC